MNNPAYINPHQPRRPRYTEDGKPLMFRTRPKRQRRMIQIHTHANQICMLKLYRAVCNEEVPQQVSVYDLYQWIREEEVFSKTNLGYVVINSVIYEPRKLVNSSLVGKATQSYMFRDMLDLKYGLEWMICIWLRKFLNDTNGPGEEQIVGERMMLEELEMLASASEDEFQEVYLSELTEWHFHPIDWEQKYVEEDWLFQEVLPEEYIAKQKEKPRTPPRDLSLLTKSGAHDR